MEFFICYVFLCTLVWKLFVFFFISHSALFINTAYEYVVCVPYSTIVVPRYICL